MKIVSFNIKNYRSIVEAPKINLNDYNVLLGKNNEGKSNIIRALSVCMNCINDFRRFRYSIRSDYSLNNKIYSWEKDFPISLQNRKIGRKSIFELELFLNDEELNEFNQFLKTRIKIHNIIMKIEIGDDNKPEVSFPTRGTNSLTKKKEQVLSFLSDKISFNYIPAIRTENHAIRLIKNNIARELETLNTNEEYINALDTIRKLQNEMLGAIGNNIKDELDEFLPKVNKVEIQIEDAYRIATSMSDINVYVNDGVLTNIENKGDGVKSLAVLAMLKNRSNILCESSFIAIDEPEAHLHPGAIDELASTLKELAKENQIIISTHNQAFINYLDLNNNIIVDSGKAKPAKSIVEIRNILGIKASDNMINARFVLLVEGKTDENVLTYVLSLKSERIKKALTNREFMILAVDSASKIDYSAAKYKRESCVCLAFIDNDDSGIKAAEKVIESKDIDPKNIFMSKCKGMNESEMEDMINPDIYKSDVLDIYGIDLNDSKFRNNKKWSIRIKETADAQCKICTEKTMSNIKKIVMECVIRNNVDESLIPQKSDVINLMIDRIESLLKND